MGKISLGVEFGSTRIKAVLVDEKGTILGVGGYDWENRFENEIWTYDLDDVWKGLQGAIKDLASTTDDLLTKVGAIGISGMMHGYLAFDKDDNLLVPFRTWRNTMTKEAADKLTELFDFNIPQRWSIAHLYNAMLKAEPHVPQVRFITSLAGYVHYKLTGKKVIGIGEASGMFPIDTRTKDYNQQMIDKFDNIASNAPLCPETSSVRELLPKVLVAGSPAGTLTEEGRKLLDPTGMIPQNTPLCPPEGDGNTGMVATNSVRQRTGNVSAGTSIFGMVVLDKDISRVYREIDIFTTPDGSNVAMAHCNNGTSELNAWIGIFSEALSLFDTKPDVGELFAKIYNHSLEGDADCSGILTYNYLSGEHVTGFEKGRPMFIRRPDSTFNLANFIRSQLYTCFATLKTGMDILVKNEGLKIDEITGHGGIFKTPGVAQRYLAAALESPVTVMETAGEGGAFGIGVLAMYMLNGAGMSLADYLSEVIFKDAKKSTVTPSAEEIGGYEAFLKQYKAGLAAERAAVDNI